MNVNDDILNLLLNNNNSIDPNTITTLEYLESLEFNNDSDIILYEKYNLILPNLKGAKESQLITLPINVFTNYMDKIILDNIELEKTVKLLNLFHDDQKICFFKSEYHYDYFIKIDFEEFLYDIPVNFMTNISICNLFDPTVRFYVIPLILNFNKTSAHANVLIIDNYFKTIEFFEPHGEVYGGTNMITYDIKNHIFQVLLKLFEDKLDILTYTYKNVQSCINFGLQSLQNLIDPISGHCLAWTLLFIHVRLYNIYVNSEDIINFFINNFTALDLDRYVKRYMTYIQQYVGVYDFKKEYVDSYRFILTNDENDKIKERIVSLTEEFMYEIKNQDKRNNILNQILLYSKYPEFKQIFSETVSKLK